MLGTVRACVLAFVLLSGVGLVGCEGWGGWTPLHGQWSHLLSPLLPRAVQTSSLHHRVLQETIAKKGH